MLRGDGLGCVPRQGPAKAPRPRGLSVLGQLREVGALGWGGRGQRGRLDGSILQPSAMHMSCSLNQLKLSKMKNPVLWSY